jgi:hypothetical protein
MLHIKKSVICIVNTNVTCHVIHSVFQLMTTFLPLSKNRHYIVRSHGIILLSIDFSKMICDSQDDTNCFFLSSFASAARVLEREVARL